MATKSHPNSPLISAPIPFMIRQIGVPVSIGAFFNTMFNVVDTIYGGLISDQALAALSLSFPIFFIIIALGFGFSQGNTALMGNALGRGDQEEAQALAMQGLVFGVLVSILLTAVILPAAPSLVTFLGATSDRYRRLALSYINPIYFGAISMITVQMLSAILNTVGKTKPGRNFLVGGFFLNLLFDPWFIFGGFGLPALGITGIALATVLIQTLGALYLAYEVAKLDLVTRESIRRYWRPQLRTLWHIVQQGFPNFLDLMGVSLGFFVITFFVSQFGQNAVAALGAASRLEQVALLPLLGLNIAVIALVAQNNGAGRLERVQTVYRTSLLYGSLIMLITMVLIALFARPLMGLFTDDAAIVEIGVAYTRIRSLGLIPNAIFFMSASALRGIERPFLPLVLNLFRFAVLPWLFIFIFVRQLGFGLTAIWVTTTAAFFITAVAAWLVATRFLPKPAIIAENIGN